MGSSDTEMINPLRRTMRINIRPKYAVVNYTTHISQEIWHSFFQKTLGCSYYEWSEKIDKSTNTREVYIYFEHPEGYRQGVLSPLPRNCVTTFHQDPGLRTLTPFSWASDQDQYREEDWMDCLE